MHRRINNNYYPCYDPCCPRPNPYPPPYPPFTFFKSSFLEAVGSTQNVAANGNIAFDTDPDTLDIAGNGIQINSDGTVFTIIRPGLYHVEWSINIGSGTLPIVVGLTESGRPSSAASNKATTGNHSSGALINVTENDLPLTLSLRNFGEALTLEDANASFGNTAVSLRILRFADAADSIQ